MSGAELELLHRRLDAKTEEIERVVAKAFGLGDVDKLDPSALRRLKKDVELIIEEHEEAILEGQTVEEWEAPDQRLAATEIGRLMQEHHEIAEQIVDLMELQANSRRRRQA
jgi:hypothetical protein